MSETVAYVQKCRCCMREIHVNELRPIFKYGKICGQVIKLADMLKFITNLEMSENDGLPSRICGKCVIPVCKAYAFKQQCIKPDEQLRQPLWRQPSPSEIEVAFQMDFDNSLSEIMECESSEQPVEMMTLNDDCLLHILRFVSLVNLCNIRDTCTRLEALADQSFKLYRGKSLTIKRRNISTGFFVLKHFGKYIESLSLNTFYARLNVFETIARCAGEQLTSISFDECLSNCGPTDGTKFECLKTVLKNVHSITLKDLRYSSDMEELLNYCESLKDVNIWNDDLYVTSDWLLRNPKVTKLTLNGLDCKNLEEIISRSKGLECLIAEYVPFSTIDDDGPIHLNKLSLTLKELAIRPAFVMIEYDLQNFADKTILKVLTLVCCYISELSADVLGDFPNLSTLTFENVVFDGNALEILSKKLARIESLRFIDCPNFTFAAVLKIHQNLLDLKKISLYYCSQIKSIDRREYLCLQNMKNLQVFLDREAYDRTCDLIGNDRLENVQLKPIAYRHY